MKKKNSVFLEVFDTLFIMMLCFATLLSAMVAKGSEISVINYSIKIPSFMLTVLCIAAYLVFILMQSDKGLRMLIDHRYKIKK